ncbi:MAG TPA: dienelactone hydrolase family protein [Sphingomonadaceae bacterium]|nr:dienelactone hydrolase family protein [Sphingomonadaceae bacterium]
MGDFITVETLEHDASFKVYRAAPEGRPRGAIIVIQEIFGVNAGIRAKCDTLAAKGWLAFAPDLFWRVKPSIELDPDVPEQFKQALGYMSQFKPDDGVRDIEAVIRAARAELGAGGKVGVVGFCLGGRMAYLTAARTDIDASVAYYGGGIDSLLGEAHAIARPLLLHFAEQDHFIDAAAREKISNALKDNKRVAIHTYAGVDHGFATEIGNRRSEPAASEADARTEAFFSEHLQ